MASRSKPKRFLRLRNVAAAAIASLLPVPVARASLLFDDISAHELGAAGANVTYSALHPNTFTGDAYVLAPGATDITGIDLFAVNQSLTNYTGLQISISIWGGVNAGTVNASAPAFSDFLGLYSLDVLGNFTKGYYYPFEGSPPGSGPNITFNTPVQLNGLSTVGITVNFEGTTNGTSYQNANNLTSLISYGVAPTIGSEMFNGFYINASGETSGNFISPLKTAGFLDQSLAIRIFGDIAPSPNEWIANAGGDWSVALDWSTSTVPTANTDAVFNLSSPNYTVTVSTAGVCKDLYIQSDNVKLELSAAGSSLAITGALTVGQPATAGSSINGFLGLAQSYGSADMNISAGSVATGGNGGTGMLTIGSGVRLISAGAVSVSNGSSLVISPGGKLVAPSISIAGTTNSWTGLVDIGTGSLDLSSGNLAIVANQVRQGYSASSGGGWNGTGGITSSAAASDSTHLTAVGVIANNDGNGNSIYGATGALGMFGGSNPSLNDVLVRYTYFGDANLDGTIDGTDYSLIDNGYLEKLTGWYNGDFNYDGVVNGSDYTLIDNAFNNQTAVRLATTLTTFSNGTALDISKSEALACATGSDAKMATPDSVPEPTDLLLLSIPIAYLLSRRAHSPSIPESPAPSPTSSAPRPRVFCHRS